MQDTLRTSDKAKKTQESAEQGVGQQCADHQGLGDQGERHGRGAGDNIGPTEQNTDLGDACDKPRVDPLT